MAVSIDVHLVSSGSPRPVQIAVTGVPAGTPYTVTGTTAAGSQWAVPGGQITSDGGQVVLIDNRTPLNTPVTYVVTAAGVTYTSTSVTVTHTSDSILQSLDGRSIVEFEWSDNALPHQLTIRAAAYDVPGRTRPPVRFASGGVGGGALEIRTSPAFTRVLTDLLIKSRPLVLRTDGTIRDLAAVELILPTSASNALFDGEMDDGSWSWRTWTLGYLFVDDPEPSTALAAFTWDDFDAAMAPRTWSDFDALFAASTWDVFDRYDWDQLQ